MMRGRTSAAAGIRRPDNSIYLYEEALNPRLFHNPLFRLPFLRGMLLLWEMLVLGTRLMTFSANVATGAIDHDAPPAPPAQPGTPGGGSASLPEEPQEPPRIGGVSPGLSPFVSFVFPLPLFFPLPPLPLRPPPNHHPP